MFISRTPLEHFSNHCSGCIKSYFAPRNNRDFAKRNTTLGTRYSAVLIPAALVLFLFGSHGAVAQQILFKENFSHVTEQWETVDVAEPVSGRPTKSQWRLGIGELSAIENEDDTDVATILLAGEESWGDYSVDATLFATSNRFGYLTGIVFGYRDPSHFYHVGYNFDEDCYELKRRTPDGFDRLAQEESSFPKREEVALRLEFSGATIRFNANERNIFDLEDGTYTQGRFGIGTSGMGTAAVLFGPITVQSLNSSDSTSESTDSSTRGDGKVLFAEDFALGSLDRWDVWDSRNADPAKSDWRVVLSEYAGITNKLDKAAAFFVTGKESWSNYTVRTNLCVTGLDGNLTGIVFGYRSTEHFYHVGYNFSNDRFELELRTPPGYEILSFAEMDFPNDAVVPLELVFTDQRILFRVQNQVVFDIENKTHSSGKAGVATSGLGDGDVALSGFEVVGSLRQDLPERQLQDLLASKTGGGVIYRRSTSLGDPFEYLLDHSLSDPEEMGASYQLDLSEVKLPEEVVLSFPQGRFVEIQRIGFQLEEQHFPKEISFWVSNDTPKSGFKPLADLTLRPQSESYQEFPVPPARAKYLKMQITNGFDSEQISIAELFVKGTFREPGLGLGETESFGVIDAEEIEPNNTLVTAQTLPLGDGLRGDTGQQDVDYYRVSPPADAGDTLTLQVRHSGILRPQLTLVSSDGTEIPSGDVAVSRGMTNIGYTVKRHDYYLKVVRPETYLTIVFDDSSSMGSSIPIVKRVLRGYLENLGPELNIKLVKYATEPTDLCDFTNDPEKLEQAIKGEVGGGGGTETFDGLMWAVNSVAQKEGNRAVLAILDVINAGTDPEKQYRDLWDAVLDNRINLTTIGVASGWDERTEFFGNSRAKIFRELAYSTQGRFFHSPSDELVKQNAEAIFEQLTAPISYSVRAEWKPRLTMVPKVVVPEPLKMASLSVRRLSEQAVGQTALPAVELILDSSNSMSEKVDNLPKSQVAREVVDSFLAALPEDTQLGLRLYGHRGVWIDRRSDPDAGPLATTDPRLNTDSELVVPIGPLTASRLSEMKRWLNEIKPSGKTPLVYSLLQAIHDFPKDLSGPRAVVLVSDGKENCGGKLSDVAKAYRGSSIDLVIHVVGFDLERDWEAKRQLGAIARLGRGKYFDTRDAQELKRALTTAIKTLSFDVLDRDSGKRIAGGIVDGDAIQLKPGKFLVQIVGGSSEPRQIELASGEFLEIHLSNSGANKAW